MTKVGELVINSSKKFELEWKIPDFSSPSLQTKVCFSGPEFYFNYNSYYLRLYPYCSGLDFTVIYIGIFLFKVKTFPSPILNVTFRIRGLNGETEACDAKTFTETNYGVHDLFLRTELFQRHLELLPSDVLTIICTIERVNPLENAREISMPVDASENAHKLLCDFRDLYLRKEDCDVIIRIKGQEFPAHKIILKARSPVFASALRLDMKEKITGIVDIVDCEPSIFQVFLAFLYCSDLKSISRENVFELFTVADKYDVQDLRVICLEMIKENLRIDTFCKAYSLGLLHSEAELIKLCRKFFFKHSREIIQTDRFKLFSITDTYDVKDFRAVCLDVIKENLCIDTFCDTISLGLLHSEDELIKLCTEFFIEKSQEIVKTDQWLYFVAENTVQSYELLELLKPIED